MKKNKKERKKPKPLSIKKSSEKNYITVRPRVAKLAKLYNVSDRRIIDFLKTIGIQNIGPNSLLSREMVICIKSEFRDDKKLKDHIRGDTLIKIVNPNDNISTDSPAAPPNSFYLPSVDNSSIPKKSRKIKKPIRAWYILSGRSKY
jgi:hypothetical protein